MTVIGDAPRPWILGVGLTDEEAAVVSPLCGHLVRMEAAQRAKYSPEEYDVIIDFGVGFDQHERVPYRLIFADPPTQVGVVLSAISSGSVLYADLGGSSAPRPTRAFVATVPARRFKITDYARGKHLERLLKESCCPEEGNFYVAFPPPFQPSRVVHVLLEEELDRRCILAAVIESRPGDEFTGPSGDLVWLPAMARPHLKEWLGFAVALWREHAPQRFPMNAGWQADDRWASAEEMQTRNALAQFDREEEGRRSISNARRLTLASHVDEALPTGVEARLLVTADAEILVTAVTSVLIALGFTVINADDLPEHKSAKQEDLRVQLGDWIALVEVKGYTKGAKINDLNQITKAAATFALGGRQADALWYVVNANRMIDPAVREIPLQSDPDSVNSFAIAWNLRVIDTTELFQLHRSVQDGVIALVDAQAQLRSFGPWFKCSLESNTAAAAS